MREQIPAAVSTLKVKGEQLKTEMQQRKLRPSEKKLLKCMEHVIMLESSLLELADANKAILGLTISFCSRNKEISLLYIRNECTYWTEPDICARELCHSIWRHRHNAVWVFWGGKYINNKVQMITSLYEVFSTNVRFIIMNYSIMTIVLCLRNLIRTLIPSWSQVNHPVIQSPRLDYYLPLYDTLAFRSCAKTV